MAKTLSWTPQRIGSIYCSSACGGRCTKQAHDEAIVNAARLALRLGKGWRPNVWENLGWYYSAVSRCGRIRVHPRSSRPSWTAFLGPVDLPGGKWVADGTTPTAAVSAVIKVAKTDLARVGALLKGL